MHDHFQVLFRKQNFAKLQFICELWIMLFIAFFCPNQYLTNFHGSGIQIMERKGIIFIAGVAYSSQCTSCVLLSDVYTRNDSLNLWGVPFYE